MRKLITTKLHFLIPNHYFGIANSEIIKMLYSSFYFAVLCNNLPHQPRKLFTTNTKIQHVYFSFHFMFNYIILSAVTNRPTNNFLLFFLLTEPCNWYFILQNQSRCINIYVTQWDCIPLFSLTWTTNYNTILQIKFLSNSNCTLLDYKYNTAFNYN